MRKFLILILFLLQGCNLNQKNINVINSNFSDDLTFDEYKKKIEEYINLSSYPNLNE